MAYQFKYDTVHGRWKGTVEVDGKDLVISGNWRIESINQSIRTGIKGITDITHANKSE
jgi:glyceraldehyde-3-phosphate dehydrogenase/erythrose-4-phosphate dehydrogenase